VVGVQEISQRFSGSYGLEGKTVAFLALENARESPSILYLQALVAKHDVYYGCKNTGRSLIAYAFAIYCYFSIIEVCKVHPIKM